MKKGLIAGLLTSVILLSFAGFVFAAIAPGLPPTVQDLPTGPADVAGLLGIIKKAANIIFTVLIILAVIFIILAAFQFITGGGDAAQVTAARSKLIWAAVGIGLAVIAQAIPAILGNFLGGS